MKITVKLLPVAFLFILVMVPATNGALSFQLQAESAAEDTVTTKHGEILIEQYCYSCHNPQMRGQQRLAPPFLMVKMHYMRDYAAKESFVDAISAWVKEPNEDKSIMPGALNRFGLMPPMMINDEDVRLIADYLYDADLPDFRGNGHQNRNMQRRHRRGFN